MRKQLRKIISILLFTVILLSSFSVSSFGADNLVTQTNLTVSPWSWGSESYYSATLPMYYNSSTTASRFTVNSSTWPTGNVGAIRYCTLNISDFDPRHKYNLSFDVYGDFSICPVNVMVNCVDSSGYSQTHSVSLVYIYANYNTGDNVYTHAEVSFIPSNISSNASKITIQFLFGLIDSGSTNLYFKNLTVTDDDSGLWSRLWSWLQSIYNKLGEMLNSLVGIASNVGQGFSNVLTDFKAFIVGGTDHNGIVHQSLASNIGSFIRNLGTTIGGFFDDLWDDLSDAFDDIGQWFIDLGEDIEDFFTMLKNYLLYFRHPVTIVNGVPVDEHGEPIYENVFDIPDFFETLEDWVDDLDNAKTDVETGASAGVQAFEDTIAPLTSILNRVPFLTVFVTFALAVIIIKKVIG